MSLIATQINRKKSILILHNGYLHSGGEDSCVDNEISALSEISDFQISQLRTKTIGTWQDMANAVFSPLGLGLESILEKQLRIDKPDILHVHNLYPQFSPRMFKIAKQIGVKTVLTLHNYRPLCLNGLCLTPKKEVCERCAGGNFWHGIIRGCYRGSRLQSSGLATHLHLSQREGWYDFVDCFIAPSEFLRRKYSHYNYPAERIVVQGHFLPHMPIEDPFPPEPYLLYLGRLSEEKGVPWLLDVFSQPLYPIQLKIAGKGPLEKDVSEKVSSSIDYIGYIEGDVKEQWIRRATALVLPSDCYENFPMIVGEANAWGVPVIVANHGAMPEMIVPGLNGESYNPHDQASFWDTVNRLLQRNTMEHRKRCQEYARETFSKKKFQDRRILLYKKI